MARTGLLRRCLLLYIDKAILTKQYDVVFSLARRRLGWETFTGPRHGVGDPVMVIAWQHIAAHHEYTVHGILSSKYYLLYLCLSADYRQTKHGISVAHAATGP
jgi:hypothetical protein